MRSVILFAVAVVGTSSALMVAPLQCSSVCMSRASSVCMSRVSSVCMSRASTVCMSEVQQQTQEERVAKAMELTPVESLTESARSTGLALALDDGTRKSHSVAENTAFVTGFFRGIATKGAFSSLVASLYFVYEAMESEFDQTQDPSVKALDYPSLRRTAALEEDMAYYFGAEWRDTVEPSPATKEYVARVRAVAQEDPYLLVAHQYTRYLGDLFGGQMMGGMARRSLKLDEQKGTRFYEFDDISGPQIKPFIEQWYQELNKLDLTDEQKERIVDEGNLVFTLNIGVFEELEGNPVKALFALASSGLRSALGLGDSVIERSF